MQPFSVPEFAGKIIDIYPDSETIMIAVGRSEESDIQSIARLWLSEGIPFAFREKPALYEVIRNWISNRLSIHPKELTLIGSARVGCSLAPPPKTGKRFNDESDLDWSAISEKLFISCKNEFELWASDYDNGIVNPNKSGKKYWDENFVRCPNTIKRGFIDPFKIPTYDKYPLSQNIAHTMWLIGKKCELTREVPKFKKSTLRVYRDWNSFIKQLSLNLKFVSCALRSARGFPRQRQAGI